MDKIYGIKFSRQNERINMICRNYLYPLAATQNEHKYFMINLFFSVASVNSVANSALFEIKEKMNKTATHSS